MMGFHHKTNQIKCASTIRKKIELNFLLPRENMLTQGVSCVSQSVTKSIYKNITIQNLTSTTHLASNTFGLN